MDVMSEATTTYGTSAPIRSRTDEARAAIRFATDEASAAIRPGTDDAEARVSHRGARET
jgi:hypothetical protein